MIVDLRTLIEFFVVFEKYVALEALPGLMGEFPRNISSQSGLLKAISSYSNCEIREFAVDFGAGLRREIDLKTAANESISTYITPAELGSLILNFDDHAEIIINDATYPGTNRKVLNTCYRRFLKLKEVFHVVLRDEFVRHQLQHPDTDHPELLVTMLEQLIYLPFSIIDFDNPEYSDVIKVEHAAELFSALTLYPIERVATDRAEFLQSVGAKNMEDPRAITSSTLPYAEQHKVPRRYVDLLFRWSRFDELHATYRMLTERLQR